MSEECGDGEGVDSQRLSDTLRYINLTGLVIELVTLRGPMYLCVCVIEECGENAGTRTTLRSDVL